MRRVFLWIGACILIRRLFAPALGCDLANKKVNLGALGGVEQQRARLTSDPLMNVCPSGTRHEAQEEEFWRWNINNEVRKNRIAIITLAISVFALVGAGYSAYESRRQADYALNQQRPWIKISIIPRELKWFHDDRNTTILLDFSPEQSITDVGESPAINVSVRMMAVAEVSSNLGSLQAKSCEEAQASNFITVFPHDTVDASLVGGGTLGAGINPNPGSPTNVFLLGCVSYFGSGRQQSYHTRFAFRLLHFNRPAGVLGSATTGIADFEFAPYVNVAPEDLKLIALSICNDAD